MLPASIKELFDLTYSYLHSLYSYRAVALEHFIPSNLISSVFLFISLAWWFALVKILDDLN